MNGDLNSWDKFCNYLWFDKKLNIWLDISKINFTSKEIKNLEDKYIDFDEATKVETKKKLQKPSLYKVLLLNDDYTPMEFVVFLLKKFFHKNNDEATKIMLHVHQNGVGVCGVFPYEIAETKVIQVLETAKKNDHPLQCTMEKD